MSTVLPSPFHPLSSDRTTDPQRTATHLLLLHVHLDKLDVRKLGLELVEVGADELARAAPGRPKVDDDDRARVDLCISTCVYAMDR
jgi:hypothetical protein